MSDLFKAPVGDLKQKPSSRRPSRWTCVIYRSETMNSTVIMNVLRVVFNRSEPQALETVNTIKKFSRAQVGVWTFELAEQKASDGTALAARQRYPLRIIPEPLPPV